MDATQFKVALERFKRIDPEIPLNAIQTFVWIAMNDGRHQNDLEQYLDASNATVSRSIQWWSNWKSFKKGVKGPNYIESFSDPMDRRYKIVTLTKDGKKFWDEIIGERDGPKERK